MLTRLTGSGTFTVGSPAVIGGRSRASAREGIGKPVAEQMVAALRPEIVRGFFHQAAQPAGFSLPSRSIKSAAMPLTSAAE